MACFGHRLKYYSSFSSEPKVNMSRENRIAIYKKIESHRKSPLLVYVTSKREGAAASMATDVLPYIIEQLDAISEDTNSLDFLIVSYGGDPMVAWRIMSL